MNELLRQWAEAQNWRELTRIRTDNPYYAASAFLAVITYPNNTDKRDKLIAAMCDYCRLTWGMTHLMRKRDVDRALNRSSKLINRRFRASGMAAKVMLEKVSSSGMTIEAARSIREAISREGEPMSVSLPTWVLPSSALSQLKRHNAQPRAPRPGSKQPESPEDIDTNVFRDVWSPSKPVLHFAHVLHDFLGSQSDHQSVGDFILNPSWAPKAIDSLPIVAMGLWRTGIVEPSELIMLRSL